LDIKIYPKSHKGLYQKIKKSVLKWLKTRIVFLPTTI